MKIPVYNCIIDESVSDETGVYAISFVDSPANEVDFVALNKNTPVFLDKNQQKQILTGVVLRPEQLIYRNSDQLGDYYIKFSADQIEKIAQKMMKTGIALHNTTHQHESTLTGNYLVELWIIENPENDKSNALGFKDLPKGTLMCSYKVADKNYWESEVMTGNVKGFSLEGFFIQEINMSKLINKSSMKKKKFVFNKVQRSVLSAVLPKHMLSDIESVEADDTTESGDPYVVFVLSDGTEVYVDADGFATINGEQAPAGEHNLADGNILVIDEQGQFVETKEASTTVDDPEQATAAQTLRKSNLASIKVRQTKTNQKLEDQTVSADDVQALKDRIEELESLLNQAVTVADDAVTEVQALKRTTPSTSPAIQKVEKDFSKMSHTERMAASLTLSLQQRTKK